MTATVIELADYRRKPLCFPAWMHGSYAEVRRASQQKARELHRGRELAEVVGDEWIDVADAPGLVVLVRQWSSISASARNFHADLLWSALSSGDEPGRRERYSTLAASSLGQAWCFSGLVASQRYGIVRRSRDQLAFLEAAREHWAGLLAVGPRFTAGSSSGRSLDQLPSLVSYCLARQGAPVSELLPLSVRRLRRLMDDLPGFRVRELARAGRLDDVRDAIERHDHQEIALLSLAEHLLDYGHDDFACDLVTRAELPDVHGIVRRWLADRRKRTRSVR